jgi:hypothetical protein
MPNEIKLADRPILRKISEAEDLLAHWEGARRIDPHLVFLLNSLDKKIMASGVAMEALGVTSACRQCAEEDGDTCCGAGIENRYTSRILLINLLLGNALPKKRFRANGCFFLSENGCSLKMRLVLCVNYLCRKIQRMLPTASLLSLQQITGEEMDESFILEEAVKKGIDGQILRKQQVKKTILSNFFNQSHPQNFG